MLYRDAPLNSIWEGSGNVAALDVLRAMVKEPDGLPAFLDECALAAGADRRLDAHLERVHDGARPSVFAGTAAKREQRCTTASSRRGASSRSWPSRCRRRCWCATRRAAVADAFCAARLGGEGGRVYGTLPAGVDAGAIIDRALPA